MNSGVTKIFNNLCSIQTYNKSIGLTELTPKDTVTDTESKLGIGLGSHKKLESEIP